MKRRRRMAMAAAGVVAATSPVLFLQQPAGAAVTRDDKTGSLQYVTTGGATVRCDVWLYATHDTDNPNRPVFNIGMAIGGSPGCNDAVNTFTTATYRDADGVTRTTHAYADGLGGLTIEGAYTGTTGTVQFSFLDCSEAQSASCAISLTGSPK
jgi:hypothetical protein